MPWRYVYYAPKDWLTSSWRRRYGGNGCQPCPPCLIAAPSASVSVALPPPPSDDAPDAPPPPDDVPSFVPVVPIILNTRTPLAQLQGPGAVTSNPMMNELNRALAQRNAIIGPVRSVVSEVKSSSLTPQRLIMPATKYRPPIPRMTPQPEMSELQRALLARRKAGTASPNYYYYYGPSAKRTLLKSPFSPRKKYKRIGGMNIISQSECGGDPKMIGYPCRPCENNENCIIGICKKGLWYNECEEKKIQPPLEKDMSGCRYSIDGSPCKPCYDNKNCIIGRCWKEPNQQDRKCWESRASTPTSTLLDIRINK